MLTLHGKIAGMTLLVLTVWALAMVQRQGAGNPSASIEIAVEHQSPATVSISSGQAGNLQLMDIGNESGELLSVSLPENWRRTEVRGAALTDVIAEEPSLGYIRWNIPAGAQVSFETANIWQSVTVHNPTGVPLKVSFTRVMLDRDEADYDVYLVKDEPVTIW